MGGQGVLAPVGGSEVVLAEEEQALERLRASHFGQGARRDRTTARAESPVNPSALLVSPSHAGLVLQHTIIT